MQLSKFGFTVLEQVTVWVVDREKRLKIGTQGLVVGFTDVDVMVNFPQFAHLPAIGIPYFPEELVRTDAMVAKCHPVTGACVFKRMPEEMECASSPGGDVDGVCRAGLCRRHVLDLCANTKCPNATDCSGESTCDPLTGKCVANPYDEGRYCSDKNVKTSNDMCIEGCCIGTELSAYSFTLVGTGFCADKSGNMLSRYFADTFDQEECEAQCGKDPGCLGYSYGYHFCAIYGGARSQHPSKKVWKNNEWTNGDLWGDSSAKGAKVCDAEKPEIAGVVSPGPNQQDCVCMKKVPYFAAVEKTVPIGHEVAFGILVAMLVFTPAIWAIMWKLKQVVPVPEVPTSFEGDFDVHKDVDKMAIENVEPFQDTTLSLSENVASPSASKVAQAPPTLEDAPTTDMQDTLDTSEVLDPRGGSVPVIEKSP